MDIAEFHPFEQCFSALQKVLRAHVRPEKQMVGIIMCGNGSLQLPRNAAENELHGIPQRGDRGKGAKILIIIRSGEFFDPIFFWIIVDESFVGKVEKGEELLITGADLVTGATIDTDGRIAGGVDGNDVRFVVMSEQYRIHTDEYTQLPK